MSAHIGVTGLAVMGANLARNLARNGFTVALHNRSVEKTDALLAKHGQDGDFVRTETLQELVDSLEKPRRVLIMVKAGKPVDSVIEQLEPLLEPGDIIIDAGNSHYEDTRRREAALAKKDLHFVGIGVSGGEEGALNGPSIMPGGSRESYDALGPLLEKIAAHVDGKPCCAWIGTDGAGHFVKMVHNGIEYADMQVIGEAFDLLRSGAGIEPAEQAKIFEEWNKGDLASFLIEISAEVLGHVDAKTGKPFVDVVVDAAGQKGTGRWTVISALELGSPTSGIAESVFARALSSQAEQRVLAQELLAGGEAAATLATQLARLVQRTSVQHGGRPIKWLGDGVMFFFKDPGPGVVAALEMVAGVAEAGLPPAHVGLHAGPVVFQEGDYYGQTVNLASRIADYARPGEVLVSQQVVDAAGGSAVAFREIGPVELKGVGGAMRLHAASTSA